MGEILSNRNMKLVCFMYHRQGGLAKAGKGRKRPCGALRVQNPLHNGDNWGGRSAILQKALKVHRV